MKLLFRPTTIISLLLALMLSPTAGWSERIHEDFNVSHGKPPVHPSGTTSDVNRR